MEHYIVVATKDHIQAGVTGGFAQVGHGKKAQLAKLLPGDWLIYYSTKDKIDGNAYQKFTAIGQVEDQEPYQVTVHPDFKPWRRKVNYYSANELEIRPLLDDLNFITNRNRWGLHLMSGFVRISENDFERIATKMLTHKKLD